MFRAKFLLLSVVLLAFGWFVLFQGTQPVSSSPLLGITMTPTQDQPKPTFTPVVPTRTPDAPTKIPVVNTLPPPPNTVTTPDSPLIIPVTGTDKSTNSNSLVNLGLVFLAFGLIAAGFSIRKPKK
jgi:hypothetical protein